MDPLIHPKAAAPTRIFFIAPSSKKRMARRWPWDIKTVRRAVEQPRTARPTGGPRRATPPPQPHPRTCPRKPPTPPRGVPVAGTPGRSRPPARRRLPLGARRCPTRSGQPRQVSGAAQSRSRTRPLPTLRGRPPAQDRLRHAPIDVAVGQAGAVEEVALPGPHSVAVMTAR